MGKNKNSSAKRPKTAPKSDAGALPSFDEQALTALTEKIEKGLGKGKAPQQAAESENRSHKQQGKSSGHKHKESSSKSPRAQEPSRGTKRDAKGNVKKAASTKHTGISLPDGNAKDDRETLLQEILALGGTEEDLDLVADAVSDDEETEASTSAAPDKSLKKELAKFVASLGIDTHVEEEADESEDDQDVDEEWEEASDMDDSTESGVEIEQVKRSQPTPDPKTKPKDLTSKDSNRLVSIACFQVNWSD